MVRPTPSWPLRRLEVALDRYRLLSIRPPRDTSPAHAPCKHLFSGLLATVLLVASPVSTHAQTNWTAAFSNGWFNPLNWSAGVPNAATSANIDTVTPNSTEIRGAGATALNLSVGQNGTGILIIRNGGNIGAGAGAPAPAPGTLNTPSVAFGAGAGTINFNHTSTDYVFAPTISGTGTVNVLAGTTRLTAANSYFGATNVNAGTLRAGAVDTFSPNSA